MIICNHLIGYICQYLDIKSLSIYLLFCIKNDITKNKIAYSYCKMNNIFTHLNIKNYYHTILYYQNKFIDKCYKCNKQLGINYYLVICNCIYNSLKVDHLIYSRYHLECLENKEKKNLKIINCEFCNKNRICFKCNIYS